MIVAFFESWRCGQSATGWVSRCTCQRGTASWLAIAFVAVLSGCASDRRIEEPARLSPTDARTLIGRSLPANIADRSGWTTDIYAAFIALDIAPTPDHICAVAAITEQESSFRTDPAVPGLGKVAWKEIDRRAQDVGIPTIVVRTALRVSSPNGKSYAERIDAATTEKDLSEIFEDFIDMVPAGKTFFADRNPVRTGGPMQVSVAFAEAHAETKTYPYPVRDTIRHEVFGRQ